MCLCVCRHIIFNTINHSYTTGASFCINLHVNEKKLEKSTTVSTLNRFSIHVNTVQLLKNVEIEISILSSPTQYLYCICIVFVFILLFKLKLKNCAKCKILNVSFIILQTIPWLLWYLWKPWDLCRIKFMDWRVFLQVCDDGSIPWLVIMRGHFALFPLILLTLKL